MRQRARRASTETKGRSRRPTLRALGYERPDKVGMLREPTVRRRVLLLEDNRHNIDELRDVFISRGCECEVALDLATARSVVKERMMDLAVVNAALPDVDDEGLIREFKAHNPRMSLVVYNGIKDKVRQRKLRSIGADSYLSRPSDLKAVGRAVEKVLASKE